MEPPGHIPFNRPHVTGRETGYIAEAVAQAHISGDGAFTARCRRRLIDLLGGHEALLVTSCTAALEMSAILAECGPGDEVIVPSYTFVTTANAFVLRGAVPVFVDIRPDTLNLDERLIEAAVTPRTKAIVPVHYAGVACAMDDILDIARGHDLVVIEDAAQAVGARLGGRALGTMGALGALSFHETKNVTCGEGGAILVNDASLVESAEIIREKGTDRKKFFRGQVDKYTWVGLGSSYVQSDLLAAFLYAQLEAREQIQRAREGVWRRYADALEGWAGEIGATLPFVPGHCEQAYHMFYVLLPSLDARARLIAHLRERGILAVFHYLPLHLSEMGRRFGGRAGQCPVAEDATERLLRLPFFTGLSESDQDEVIDAILAFAA
jgi:dTDP-4-amino-4,6-dideoxygalactose transaminase